MYSLASSVNTWNQADSEYRSQTKPNSSVRSCDDFWLISGELSCGPFTFLFISDWMRLVAGTADYFPFPVCILETGSEGSSASV